MDSADAREAEIALIARSAKTTARLQEHLQEIIEGPAFKGSHRSGQFLRYIVDQAIAGHFESLKERVIGMELFGRSPSYDTGEDAIVRVTASDVRKRLLQHYGKSGESSSFRVNLPPGSYVPEIVFEDKENAKAIDSSQPLPPATTNPNEDSSTAAAQPSFTLPTTAPGIVPKFLRSNLSLWSSAALLVVAISGGAIWVHLAGWNSRASSVLPWSAIFRSTHDIQLITSDPNIAEIEFMTDRAITVSDYANHNYIPSPNNLTPDQASLCRNVLRGDKSAAVDAPIAVRIAELTQSHGRTLAVHGARDIQLSDLKTDDNFIFLGSPLSNPWTSIFADQLDFRFVFDPASHSEVVRNFHPRPKEKPIYVPSALGWQTGDSFAILALVRNPDQNGQVLLLSGANGEGTEAAGRLVVDLPRLARILRDCGVTSSGPLQHFEILLHLRTMAGSSGHVDVEACHAF